MPLYDMPLGELERYSPPREEPHDFDLFWQTTLDAARQHPLNARFEPVDAGLRTVDVFDVTFAGYGGGRGLPTERLLWSSAGFAHFVMDTRGQGSASQPGDTPDLPDGANPHFPGFMTQGILDPKTYYYRRLFTDGVRAVEAARTHPAVDARRVAVRGASQGGAITLAVGGLVPDLAAVLPDVPFMCHIRRATEIVDTNPYMEIVRYCMVHRDQVDTVFHTLAYFDGVNFAARATAEALFSVGLMDDICPPSTVYAAYNAYAGPKAIRVYPYNRHEGGAAFQEREQLRFLRRLRDAPAPSAT